MKEEKNIILGTIRLIELFKLKCKFYEKKYKYFLEKGEMTHKSNLTILKTKKPLENCSQYMKSLNLF